MMKEWLMIFIGGGLGSVCRYAWGRGVLFFFPSSFPWGTLSLNIVACLVVGILAGLLSKAEGTVSLRFLGIIGFCGGFSTFSSFSYEVIHLWGENHRGFAFIYLGLSVVLGLMATALGLWVSKCA